MGASWSGISGGERDSEDEGLGERPGMTGRPPLLVWVRPVLVIRSTHAWCAHPGAEWQYIVNASWVAAPGVDCTRDTQNTNSQLLGVVMNTHDSIRYRSTDPTLSHPLPSTRSSSTPRLPCRTGWQLTPYNDPVQAAVREVDMIADRMVCIEENESGRTETKRIKRTTLRYGSKRNGVNQRKQSNKRTTPTNYQLRTTNHPPSSFSRASVEPSYSFVRPPASASAFFFC